METIEVIDSAIKIGLGASIGGVVSLITLRIAHRNERDKEFRAHRIKTFEGVASHVDEFFNPHLRLLSKIAWHVDENGGEQLAMTEQMDESIRKPDQDLLTASDGVRVVASRLRLLGAKKCVEDLRMAADLIMKLRNTCAFNRTFPSAAEIDAHRQEIAVLSERAQEWMHSLYEKWRRPVVHPEMPCRSPT